MSRRSRLPVLIRLAEHEESRAMQTLGRTRLAVTRAEAALHRIRSDATTTLLGSVLQTGRPIPADTLTSEAMRGAGLRLRAEAIRVELEGARKAEGTARETVVAAKLRLRTLRKAVAQRERRTRREQMRRETRRLDEVQRGMRSLEAELP
ncbi:MAG: hypothetical protein ACE5FG_04765 [Myxococcota bacterium]